jgi:sporulation protein YlmC with PRC-barrel domain
MPVRSLSRIGNYTWPVGAFDVRRWEVRSDRDDRRIGKVHDALIDDDGNVCYLDIDLTGHDRHVLLPIGLARVDRDHDVIRVTGGSRGELARVPEWDGDEAALDRAYELKLDDAYAGRYTGDRYYDRPEYHADWFRGRGEDAAPTNLGTSHARVRRLGELDDYVVADHDDDPRGWKVVDRDGDVIGEVDDLIVDLSAMKARYLEVAWDEDARVPGSSDEHVMIPVGYVRLDGDDERVHLAGLAVGDLADLPTHSDGPIEHEFEERLRLAYTAVFAGGRRYEHPRYDATRFYGTAAIDRVVHR